MKTESSKSIQILSFVGSLRGDASDTRRISHALAKRFALLASAEGFETRYECITGDRLPVAFCRGCGHCFREGFCPLDEKDGMRVLKQKMLDADVLFFGTPVYVGDLSGYTKSVLDRLGYWMHRLELAGKAGVAMVSTDRGYGPPTAEKLRRLLCFTGLSVPDTVVFRNCGSPSLSRPDEANPILDRAAGKLLAAWKNPGAYITPEQERHWAQRALLARRYRPAWELLEREPPDEIRVCIQRWIDACASLADYVNARKEKRSETGSHP